MNTQVSAMNGKTKLLLLAGVVIAVYAVTDMVGQLRGLGRARSAAKEAEEVKVQTVPPAPHVIPTVAPVAAAERVSAPDESSSEPGAGEEDLNGPFDQVSLSENAVELQHAQLQMLRGQAAENSGDDFHYTPSEESIRKMEAEGIMVW